MESSRLLMVHGCKPAHSHLRHMERTLERLLQIQAAMEELAVALDQAEGVRDAWEPVGDLFIDSLQDHIDATKVRSTTLPSTYTHVSCAQRTDLNPYKCVWSHWSCQMVAREQLSVIFTLCWLYSHQTKSVDTATFAECFFLAHFDLATKDGGDGDRPVVFKQGGGVSLFPLSSALQQMALILPPVTLKTPPGVGGI